MTSRQAGHFFFEPRGYDHINQATHEHKEDIKVGYNLRRKVVLMSIWAALSASVVLRSDAVRAVFALGLAGRFHAPGRQDLAGGGRRRRCCSAPCICSSSATSRPGLVWMTKILTDPFNDFKLYHKAPLLSAEKAN